MTYVTSEKFESACDIFFSIATVATKFKWCWGLEKNAIGSRPPPKKSYFWQRFSHRISLNIVCKGYEISAKKKQFERSLRLLKRVAPC